MCGLYLYGGAVAITTPASYYQCLDARFSSPFKSKLKLHTFRVKCLHHRSESADLLWITLGNKRNRHLLPEEPNAMR